MLRSKLLLPGVLVVACSSLAACQKSATVGAFALDVPNGWYAETEEPGSLALGTDHAEWTFVLLTFTAGSIEGDQSLAAVGQEVAKQLSHKDESSEDDPSLSFGEPRTWSRPGIEGVTMDGSLADAEVSLDIYLLVIISADQYLVAFGFRSPAAADKHDKAMQAMLDSIRLDQ